MVVRYQVALFWIIGLLLLNGHLLYKYNKNDNGNSNRAFVDKYHSRNGEQLNTSKGTLGLFHIFHIRSF